jgi:hypothetical protein
LQSNLDIKNHRAWLLKLIGPVTLKNDDLHVHPQIKTFFEMEPLAFAPRNLMQAGICGSTKDSGQAEGSEL